MIFRSNAKFRENVSIIRKHVEWQGQLIYGEILEKSSELKGTNIKIDDILSSFDVVSLFTMILINETMKNLKTMNTYNPQSTFLCFQGENYEKTCGLARPTYLWRTSRKMGPRVMEELRKFIDHLNTQSNSLHRIHHGIRGKSFVTICLHHCKEKLMVIAHKVYMKKMHKDKYLHSNSHQHPDQNMGVLNT